MFSQLQNASSVKSGLIIANVIVCFGGDPSQKSPHIIGKGDTLLNKKDADIIGIIQNLC